MLKDIDTLKKLMMLNSIPREMFWAYEAVRRSGIWNMLCFDPLFCRYCIDSNPKEAFEAMERAYYKFIEYTEVDFEALEYKKLSKDHIKIMQQMYGDLADAYLKDYPEGVVNITLERKVSV